MSALIVMARAPFAGRSKTRLCPPCTPEQAADLAKAALEDTLEAVTATRAARRVLALEGAPGGWIPEGFEVIDQRGNGLGRRLAAAFADVGAPALAIGMDTPQLTPGMLNWALDALLSPGVDSVLGPAEDGGYWAIGLRAADARVFEGVPMSTAHTCEAQLKALDRLGLVTSILPRLRDVDYFEDARAVSKRCAGSRFERAFQCVLTTAYPTRAPHQDELGLPGVSEWKAGERFGDNQPLSHRAENGAHDAREPGEEGVSRTRLTDAVGRDDSPRQETVENFDDQSGV